MFDQKEYMQRYKREHKERIKQLNKESYLRHRDEILARRRLSYALHRKERRAYFNSSNQRLKVEVLTFYSNSNRPMCVVCGEERLACLSIDHLDTAEGTLDRKRGRLGHTLYAYLKKLEYPEGYQTLCMNCQFIRKHSKIKTGKVYGEIKEE